MSFSGVHHGFIEPHRTTHTWLTSSQMVTQWVLMMMTSPLVGMTSELGQRFFFPRSCSITELLFFTCTNYKDQIKIYLYWAIQQEFLEKTTEEFQLYKAHSDNYICSLMPGTSSFQAQYTPGMFLC